MNQGTGIVTRMECVDDFSNAPSSPTIVSFRDPGGRVIVTGRRVYRLIVNDESSRFIPKFLASSLFSSLVSAGMLIETQQVTSPSAISQVKDLSPNAVAGLLTLEHEYVTLPSYPYEWPPEMLHAAGELTLSLMESLLEKGLGLKDASPYNVLFRGPEPVFVDLLSVEPRRECDPTWAAYAQFVRTFVHPLLAVKYFGVSLHQTFRVYRDGLQPEQLFRMCGFWRKLRRPFLTSVSLPTLLSKTESASSDEIYRKRETRSCEQAKFILQRQLKSLRRQLSTALPASEKSDWSEYTKDDGNCAEYRATKSQFIRSAIAELKPKRLLDVGCNTGEFSVLAARAGTEVVAIDSDPVVVGRVWRRARAEGLKILPLVIDLTRPTPSLGWRNKECPGFLDRTLGSFDCVLMLAVVHHMLITERIPLEEVMALAWDLTSDRLLIEYVDPEDEMFQRLTRGNEHLYRYLTWNFFEDVSEQFFTIESRVSADNPHRWLYQMRKRGQVATN